MDRTGASPVRGVCWSGILVFMVLEVVLMVYAVRWCVGVMREAVRNFGE